MSNVESVVPIKNDLNLEEIEIGKIKEKIFTIRGRQIMIDSDVARLYHSETKYVNRVVKRNIERFPEEFCFQLTEKEYYSLKTKVDVLNLNKEKMR